MSDQNVIVVAGNEEAAEAALRFGVYFCQNERSFRPSKFIAFYKSQGITNVFEILEEPEDHIKSENLSHLADYNKAYPENISKNRKMFKLKKVESITLKIENDAEDKRQDAILNQRYTTLSSLVLAKSMSDISWL